MGLVLARPLPPRRLALFHRRLSSAVIWELITPAGRRTYGKMGRPPVIRRLVVVVTRPSRACPIEATVGFRRRVRPRSGRGGFGPDDIDVFELTDLLASLVDKSLVVAELVG